MTTSAAMTLEQIAHHCFANALGFGFPNQKLEITAPRTWRATPPFLIGTKEHMETIRALYEAYADTPKRTKPEFTATTLTPMQLLARKLAEHRFVLRFGHVEGKPPQTQLLVGAEDYPDTSSVWKLIAENQDAVEYFLHSFTAFSRIPLYNEGKNGGDE